MEWLVIEPDIATKCHFGKKNTFSEKVPKNFFKIINCILETGVIGKLATADLVEFNGNLQQWAVL